MSRLPQARHASLMYYLFPFQDRLTFEVIRFDADGRLRHIA